MDDLAALRLDELEDDGPEVVTLTPADFMPRDLTPDELVALVAELDANPQLAALLERADADDRPFLVRVILRLRHVPRGRRKAALAPAIRQLDRALVRRRLQYASLRIAPRTTPLRRSHGRTPRASRRRRLARSHGPPGRPRPADDPDGLDDRGRS